VVAGREVLRVRGLRRGDNAIDIVDTSNGAEFRKIRPLPNAAINNPAWSPDGRVIAFSGTVGGISDLYLFDLEANTVRQLTHDKYGDFMPDWSPDGRTIAFVSDRGPETDFEKLSYSELRISFIDVAGGKVETPEILGNVRHSNPQYAPDGTVYFLSDGDGFSDIYRYRPGITTTSGTAVRTTGPSSGSRTSRRA
jgi:Tol biopolymer transport system component